MPCRRGTPSLGTASPGSFSLGRPQFPVHHGTSLTTVRKEYSQEHEETADQTECPHGVLGLVGNVEIGDGLGGTLQTVDFGPRVFVDAVRADAQRGVEGGTGFAGLK